MVLFQTGKRFPLPEGLLQFKSFLHASYIPSPTFLTIALLAHFVVQPRQQEWSPAVTHRDKSLGRKRD
ncbi:hypothetical protein BDZ91DRAFT_260954 [Kalaharituber pfeilii]|nr:hypothetical protein BDZ91DRAFT_260954 [Kalaharituber pfeilii]